MKRRDNSEFSPPAVGGTSLMVVFAVLCLTVFALLSLTTVRADDRMSKSSAQAVLDYYSADCKAQKIIARLRSGEIPDGVVNENGIYKFECSASQTQSLEVEVSLGNGGFEVLRWELTSTGEWNTDNNLYVWDGSEFE